MIPIAPLRDKEILKNAGALDGHEEGHVMLSARGRCNTVPIEKGTETTGRPKTLPVKRLLTDEGRIEEIADVTPDVAEETADAGGATSGSFATGS
jgi:hypothetical protein